MANLAGIMQLYTAYFNRAADKAGVDYWAGMMDSNGWSLDDVAQSFSDQTEYQNQYNGLVQSQIVAKVYQNVLNRDGEADGINYWSGELSSGNISVSQLVQAIVNAAVEKDGSGNYKNATDASIFNNKIEVSQYCYDNNINATGSDTISLSSISTDSSSVSTIKNHASSFIDDSNGNSSGGDTINLGLSTPVYLESKTYTDSNADGVSDYSVEYSYTYSNGLINKFYNDILESTLKIDSNGNIIEETSYDSNGALLQTTILTYNNQGQVLTTSTTEDNGFNLISTNSWTSNSVTMSANYVYDGYNFQITGIGTGLNSTQTDPIKWEVYYDGELSSIDYYAYDSNGNEIEDKEDYDADGIIDTIYTHEYILIA